MDALRCLTGTPVPTFEAIKRCLPEEDFSGFINKVCDLFLDTGHRFNTPVVINGLIKIIDMEYFAKDLPEKLEKMDLDELVDGSYGKNGVFMSDATFGPISANSFNSPLLVVGQESKLFLPNYNGAIYLREMCNSDDIPGGNDFNALYNYIRDEISPNSPLLKMLNELKGATAVDLRKTLACKFFQQLLKTLNARENGLPVIYHTDGGCGGHYSAAAMLEAGTT
jgi:hypothetical protein